MDWILWALAAVLVLGLLFGGAAKAAKDDPQQKADVTGGECGLVVLMLIGFALFMAWKLFLETRR